MKIDECFDIGFGHCFKHFPELIFSGVADLLVNIGYDLLQNCFVAVSIHQHSVPSK